MINKFKDLKIIKLAEHKSHSRKDSTQDAVTLF